MILHHSLHLDFFFEILGVFWKTILKERNQWFLQGIIMKKVILYLQNTIVFLHTLQFFSNFKKLIGAFVMLCHYCKIEKSLHNVVKKYKHCKNSCNQLLSEQGFCNIFGILLRNCKKSSKMLKRNWKKIKKAMYKTCFFDWFRVYPIHH